ncbi:MAG: hypothetical protein DLM54_03415 [Acidimicrobiales bacterium]|nr:MAG: hypothetical protein DLM54_03415 [Acidimicrobiales bacterium]
MTRRAALGTSTSNFGVSRRESHDASGLYARFAPRQISTAEEVKAPPDLAEPIVCADARHLGRTTASRWWSPRHICR